MCFPLVLLFLIFHLGLWASQVALVIKKTHLIKNPPASAGYVRDMGLILGLGRLPGGGHDNLLQYSCLKNPMDRGAWRAMIHRVTESDTTEVTLHAHMHPLTT